MVHTDRLGRMYTITTAASWDLKNLLSLGVLELIWYSIYYALNELHPLWIKLDMLYREVVCISQCILSLVQCASAYALAVRVRVCVRALVVRMHVRVWFRRLLSHSCVFGFFESFFLFWKIRWKNWGFIEHSVLHRNFSFYLKKKTSANVTNFCLLQSKNAFYIFLCYQEVPSILWILWIGIHRDRVEG